MSKELKSKEKIPKVSIHKPVEVSVEIDGTVKRLRGYITDVEGNKISIDAPMSKGAPVPLRPGSNITVALVEDDAVYEFEAGILERKMDRIPILVLTAPEEVTRVQRRGYYRFPIEIDITFQVVEKKGYYLKRISEPKTVLTRDISAGGISFRDEKKIPIGTNIIVEFCLPGDFVPFVLESRIVRITTPQKTLKSDKNQIFNCAEFLNMNESDRERLVKFILIEERKRIAPIVNKPKQ